MISYHYPKAVRSWEWIDPLDTVTLPHNKNTKPLMIKLLKIIGDIIIKVILTFIK